MSHLLLFAVAKPPPAPPPPLVLPARRSDSLHRGLGVLPALAAVMLSACVRPNPDAPHDSAAAVTAAGMRCSAQTLSRLYFGLDSPQGPVSEAAWQRFVDDEITPRLPGGFTLLDARGQWRGPGGAVAREASRVLEVVAESGPPTLEALGQIVGRYRLLFQQQAVLMTQQATRACL